MGNRVLLLLIQLDDGSVWPYYAEEKSLRKLKVIIRSWQRCFSIASMRYAQDQAVLGFKDFTNYESFCNGN